MDGSNPGTVALVFNYLYWLVSGVSAIWVLVDTRKRGRPLSESIAWALFLGFMFPLAIVVYIYFRRKKLL